MAVTINEVIGYGPTLRALILITGADVGRSMTVRVAPDTPPWGTAEFEAGVVRGWFEVPAPASAVIVDHELPLGVPVAVQVYLDGVLVVSGYAGYASVDAPLLTDPIWGQHIPVTILTWDVRQYERAGQVLEVSGSPSPVIIDSFERRATSTLRVLHRTGTDSASRLAARLAASSVLMIRPSCAHLEAAWVSVRARRRSRFSKAPDSAIVDELELVHIDKPWPDMRAVLSTLAELHAAVPTTLAAIRTRWPGTLGDIALEDLS